MYCLKCNKVIKDKNTVCPECGSELTDLIPEAEPFRLEAMKPVKLVTVVNNYDAGIILNLLESNDIPCLKKDKFTGGYMNLLMGFSVYGQDIYVDEEDYERAMELITILDPNISEDHQQSLVSETYDFKESETVDPDLAEEEIPFRYPVFYKNPRIVARIILGFMVAGMIAAAIIGYINS